MAGNLRHRRLAGCFFAVAENLAQEGPQDDRRGVNAVAAEEPAVSGKGPLDAFPGENLREGQAVVCQKRLGDSLETDAAAVGRIGYILAHEKALPGECAASTTRKGSIFIARQGFISEILLDGAGSYPRSRFSPRPDCAPASRNPAATVPFVAGTFFSFAFSFGAFSFPFLLFSAVKQSLPVSNHPQQRTRAGWDWRDVLASATIVACILGAYLYFRG
jgi:hypothetical protein